jgi:putative ABC transport system ATP-binding protein
MITIKNLSKIFQTEEIETKALHEVSITINQGEFVTIMGASGSGKSILLNIVGLLDSASSGSYQLLSQEIFGLKEREKSKIRKQNIGFVFQNFNLIDELSVYDNIELPLIYNDVSATVRKQKVEKIAERLGISHRLKHYPQQLSGG